mgnify:CR=1 FL=1
MNERNITGRTREILSQHKIQLKKSLGQNFLVSDHVLDKIIAAAKLDNETGVLEIGSGIGALTERLAKSAGAVTALEIDGRLIPLLAELFSDQPHVTIIHEDVMVADLKQILEEMRHRVKRCSVVANLPYYVTSPILMRLLTERLPLNRIVVMMQKEVAERLVALPGTKAYGVLTVATQFFSKPRWVTSVSRNAFIPRPDVDSAVVCLDVREKPAVSVSNQDLFFKIVRTAFAQRRKTLLNTLAAGFPQVRKEELQEELIKIGIDPRRRGETLSIEEFAQLTDRLDDRIS